MRRLVRIDIRSLVVSVAAVLAVGQVSAPLADQDAAPPPLEQRLAHQRPKTRLVLLGTGTPVIDPTRWGPAAAIVVDNQAYLVDAGAGVVRRAAGAAAQRGIPSLRPRVLRYAFITHLHSDHTVGLPDLMLSPWIMGRPFPLEIYGPPGLKWMIRKIEDAWRDDIGIRLNGIEPQTTRNYQMNVHEIKAGVVYKDDHVTVEAFEVAHGGWQHAFGYKFTTADRTIVISGDTRPSDNVITACNGCDILMHEVYSKAALEEQPFEWQAYHTMSHTSTAELAEVAKKARPKLLILYHELFGNATEADLIREIRQAGYDGLVVTGRGLQVF